MVVYSYKSAPTVSSLWEDGRRVLGSYDVITDANGNVVERLSFDAWGNRRNSIDWREKEAPGTPHLFTRGFTGHEHLDKYGVINMNGRLYDPTIGRFFSPDPFVADATSTQGFNRYSYANNCPTMYIDPSGEIAWFIPIIIGAVVGGYTGYKVAEAKGYDIGNLKTWGYMLGGAVIGGVSGYMGATIATGGGFMANTMAIVGSSYVNSVGMAVLSDGMIQPSVSFGATSYNFGIGEWGYLGKKGNKWYQNMGYGFGALANLTDIVSLFGGGTNVSAITEKKDAISHAAVVGDDINISVGPLGGGYFDKNQSFFEKFKNLFKMVDGDGDWENHLTDGNGWKLSINNVNKNILTKLSENLAVGKNFMGNPLQYNGVGFSCVSYASRALWAVGVPNIGLHPYLWQASLMIRQVGIYSSPYLYQTP